jgi:hypothetical protein
MSEFGPGRRTPRADPVCLPLSEMVVHELISSMAIRAGVVATTAVKELEHATGRS